MISQGFPLWAIDRDGDAFLVIGWLPNADHITYPVLVPIAPEVRGAVTEDSDGRVYRYTTTDPSPDPGVDYRADSDRLADLIGRMVRLADEFEREQSTRTAALIRRELRR